MQLNSELKQFLKYLITSLILSFILNQSAQAKRFANEYTEFELPMGWECALEGAEWVCQSETEERRKEAIIILAAKIRGEQDSLEQYLGYLKAAKTYNLPGGKTQVSESKYAKVTEINNYRWIDALHLASEVPGFYTRYVATVKEDLGVAITFSVAKDQYNSYQGIFDKVIGTLRVFRQKQVDLAQYKLKAKDENLLDTNMIDDEGGGIVATDPSLTKKKGSGKSSDNTLIFIGVGVAALAFFIMRRKKK
jgi:LPXTG-motif cell wall-anchored protein